MRALLLTLPLLAGCPAGVTPDPPVEGGEIDEEQLLIDLEDLAEQARVPGLASCLLADRAVRWCGAVGEADVEGGIDATPDTAFLLASVSKTVTATAVLQRRDAGDFTLDESVDGLVPFAALHPDGDPMPLRALLSHTGGVADNWDVMDAWYREGADPDLSLAAVIEGYFDPAGAWYDADANFGVVGEFDYANMGSSLAGYVAEAASGTDLQTLTSNGVFEPLGMTNTSWLIADFAPGALAVPHEWIQGGFEPYGHYSFADYPSGGLRSSAADLGRFAAGWLSAEVLPQASIDEAFTPVIVDGGDGVGLGWFGQGDTGWIGHSGGEAGAATGLYLHPQLGVGYLVLMNGDATEAGQAAIDAYLGAIAEELAGG
jgi:CubicO group peptidase (beta-lactamase class C family)